MKILIIGCGHMGTALAKMLASHHQLFLFDHKIEHTNHLASLGYGVSVQDFKKAAQECSLAILAIKPKNLDEFVKNAFDLRLILVSLLGGVSLYRLNQAFPFCPLVRCIPNLPILVKEGMIGLCENGGVSNQNKTELHSLFEPLGKVYWLKEENMDAFTALTSCAPAFIFFIVKALRQAGAEMGLSVDESKEFIDQMLKGSAKLLEEKEMTPDELIFQIASPNGATKAGLDKMEEGRVKETMIQTSLASFYKLTKDVF